jgi:hypothetical protein
VQAKITSRRKSVATSPSSRSTLARRRHVASNKARARRLLSFCTRSLGTSLTYGVRTGRGALRRSRLQWPWRSFRPSTVREPELAVLSPGRSRRQPPSTCRPGLHQLRCRSTCNLAIWGRRPGAAPMAHAAARPFPGESKGTTEVPLGKCAVRHKSTAASTRV